MFNPMSIGDVFKVIVAGLVCGALGLMFGTWHGEQIGKAEAAKQAAENSVRILKERGKIDEQVNAADAAALCGSYGLSDDDQNECVRRVREAQAKP